MIIKMRKIILVLLTGIMLTGCGNDNIAYFPYGDSGNTGGAYEVKTSDTGLSLMSDGLCVLSDKNVNNLTDKPSFNAKSVIVSSDEEAIYSKNCFKKMYPASLTKMMTAYVVFAKEKNLDRTVKIDGESIKISEPLAKKIRLMDGDEVTIRQLLNAALVTSANDAAKALAVAVAGSEEKFAALMNEEAKKIGATHSRFVNSTGLHDTAHYSTLYDLYLIFNELLKNPEFVKIVNQGSYTMKHKNSAGVEVVKTMSSTNQYLAGVMKVPDGYTVIGGKTGTTDEAGSCILMSFKSSSDKKYIVGVLKASDALNLYAQLGTVFENLPQNIPN
jgi:hypothetical protein